MCSFISCLSTVFEVVAEIVTVELFETIRKVSLSVYPDTLAFQKSKWIAQNANQSIKFQINISLLVMFDLGSSMTCRYAVQIDEKTSPYPTWILLLFSSLLLVSTGAGDGAQKKGIYTYHNLIILPFCSRIFSTVCRYCTVFAWMKPKSRGSYYCSVQTFYSFNSNFT